MDKIDIVANLEKIQERIAEAARRSGREADAVTLVAVSKTKPFEMIRILYDAGHRDFGENRVEEALQKVEEGSAEGMDDIRWHMIGTVQSRKSSQCVGPFVFVHSVDRMKLATRLSRDAVAADLVLSVLLQVNISGEGSKHGFTRSEIQRQLPELANLPNFQIRGLMTMAPLEEDVEETRPVFSRLRDLRDDLKKLYPTLNLDHLSMGMTNDFEVAIEEGSTMVRIGSAIFGER